MARKALVVYGGWDGHEPKATGEVFARVLAEDGFEVETADTLEAFRDAEKLKGLALIVPHWTMGQLEGDLTNNVSQAVQSGVGLAGIHGGMCDAFRNNCTWQFMTGGQFVGHPGNDGTKYTVKPGPVKHAITEGIEPFEVASEQYYMHVDPANVVLATTTAPVVPGPHEHNGAVEMPVIWTRRWGEGRVYYNALGHKPNIVEMPPVLTTIRRGFLWAARG